MFLAPLVIVAALSSDFLEAAILPAAPEPVASFSDTGAGELLVTFAPAGMFGSAPRGATRVELGVLNLSASCDSDIRLDSVRLRHTGLGAFSDISGVYLADGFRRISRASQFDHRSGEVDLRVPSLVIPKCSAVRLSALVNIAADATVASEHGLTIDGPSSVQSSARNTTFSYGGESKKITATPDRTGTVTLNFLPVNGRLRYGRMETLARLQFSADALHDYLLKRIVLTNRESARDMDFINLRLETRSGTGLTTTAARMKGRTLTLEFSPTYILERSRTTVFLLKGEVRGSQSRKVDFVLEETSDLHVVPYRLRK